uniref:Nudix hydrolase domain-containing protein n=1 Tax=Ditylenchus dipsaci TaxID=166011 RepID=A0A915DPK8_9BILA
MLVIPGKRCSLYFLPKIVKHVRCKASLVGLLEQTTPAQFAILCSDWKSSEAGVTSGCLSPSIFATKKQIEAVKDAKRESAVLVALVDLPVNNGAEAGNKEELEPYVVFTLRSSLLRAHPGEVSFPGGKVETEVAESSEQAALRETREEIGIPEKAVQVLGHLRPVLTRSGTGVVTPVVGVLKNDQNMIRKLVPKTDEVHTIFVAPLSELITTLCYTTFHYEKLAFNLPVFFLLTTKSSHLWRANRNCLKNGRIKTKEGGRNVHTKEAIFFFKAVFQEGKKSANPAPEFTKEQLEYCFNRVEESGRAAERVAKNAQNLPQIGTPEAERSQKSSKNGCGATCSLVSLEPSSCFLYRPYLSSPLNTFVLADPPQAALSTAGPSNSYRVHSYVLITRLVPQVKLL